jgi:hypothetical protein
VNRIAACSLSLLLAATLVPMPAQAVALGGGIAGGSCGAGIDLVRVAAATGFKPVPAAANGTVPAAANGTVLAAANGTVLAAANGTVLAAANGTVPAAANGTVLATTNSTAARPEGTERHSSSGAEVQQAQWIRRTGIPVDEPGILVLLAAGVLGIWAVARRRDLSS